MRVRFNVTDAAGTPIETTDWAEEHTRDVAVNMVADLRKAHGPKARISIERDRVILNPKPKVYRFDITVKSGVVTVIDDEGQRPIDVKGMTLHSRTFQDFEREKVLAEVKEKFPDSIIIEREL